MDFMKFTKMHGLGNDYVVVEWTEVVKILENRKVFKYRKIPEFLECRFPPKYSEITTVLKPWIQHICDRHFGIGADGVLIICPSQTADFRMLIYNADGSRAKMCGNGIRCCAKYMFDSGRFELLKKQKESVSGRTFRKKKYICVKSGENMHNNTCKNYKSGDFELYSGKLLPEGGENYDKTGIFYCQSGAFNPKCMNIDTDSGVKFVKILKKMCWTTGSSLEILVNMGKPSTDYEHLNIEYQGHPYTVIPVSMGNLHAVVFLDETEIYTELAMYIQNMDYFADSVNVEFVQIIDNNHIQMRVWERGVGETLACGTGACAACVAAIANKQILPSKKTVNVKLKGGTLGISWTPGEDVWMTGEAVTVFEGEY